MDPRGGLDPLLGVADQGGGRLLPSQRAPRMRREVPPLVQVSQALPQRHARPMQPEAAPRGTGTPQREPRRQ